MEKRSRLDDPFWVNDPALLFKPDRLLEFYPSKDMNVNERVNAITRFILYLGIIVTLLRQENTKPLIMSFIVALGIAVTFYPKSDKSMLTLYYNRKRQCMESTANNPYMNLLPDDPNFAENRILKPCEEDLQNNMNSRQYDFNPMYTVPRDTPRNEPIQRK